MPSQPALPAVPLIVPILSLFAGAVRRPLARLPIGRRTESSLPMEKRQLIEDIRRLNQTATFKFLARFDDQALREYLGHLNEARAKHVRPALPTPRRAERVLV